MLQFWGCWEKKGLQKYGDNFVMNKIMQTKSTCFGTAYKKLISGSGEELVFSEGESQDYTHVFPE